MKKILLNSIFIAVMGWAAAPLYAMETSTGAEKLSASTSMPMKRSHLFEERAGSWKGTCDEMEDHKVYCRIFHIEQFGEWKAKNFVQIGPAWAPNSIGFVIATYLGFKEGTLVTVGIDKNKRYEFTAPRGNNLMVAPDVAEQLLQEMKSGNKLVVYFNSYSGTRQLSLTDLGPFNELRAKVEKQMAEGGRMEGAK